MVGSSGGCLGQGCRQHAGDVSVVGAGTGCCPLHYLLGEGWRRRPYGWGTVGRYGMGMSAGGAEHAGAVAHSAGLSHCDCDQLVSATINTTNITLLHNHYHFRQHYTLIAHYPEIAA